jgi:hypothetical protein
MFESELQQNAEVRIVAGLDRPFRGGLQSGSMSQESLNLRLAGLPAGQTTYHGELEFVALDAAEEEEPYAVVVTSAVHHLGARILVRGTVSGHATSTAPLPETLRAPGGAVQPTLERAPPVTGRGVGVPENAPDTISRRMREAVLEELLRTLCADDCKGCARSAAPI